MANILTDDSATFAADDVFADTKVNNTPRSSTDSAQWVIAQWANEVDSALKSLSEFLHGDSAGGTAGTVLTMLGGLSVAENATVLGSALQVGQTSLSASSISLLGTNTSAQHLYFGDAGSATAGGFDYSHTSDLLELRAGSASRVGLTTAALKPTAHNTTDLGLAGSRWRECYVNDLFAVGSAQVGTGADVTLTIDGSSTATAEPKIDFNHGGALAGRIDAAIDSDGSVLRLLATSKIELQAEAGIMPRSDSTARLALTTEAGLFQHDTDTDSFWYHNGASWLEISKMPTIAMGFSNGRVGTANPATLGETSANVPCFFFGNAATQTVHWYIQIPHTYLGGSCTLRLWWTGTSGAAGNVVWNFGFEKFAVDGDLSADGRIISASTEAGPSVLYKLKTSDVTLANNKMDAIEPGDFVRVTLSRIGADGADTYVGSAAVLGMQLIQD